MNKSRNTVLRESLFVTQKGICHYCKLPTAFKDWTLDHIWPKSRGGTRHLDNIVGACKDCNNDKADSTRGLHAPKTGPKRLKVFPVPRNGIPEIE